MLARYLKDARADGRTQVWLAGVLRVAQPTISHWLRGSWRPPAEQRKALFKVAGIPEDAWLTDEEILRIEDAARAAQVGPEVLHEDEPDQTGPHSILDCGVHESTGTEG